jgi:hypothetical protein
MRLSVTVDGARPVPYVTRDLSAGGALLVEGPALAVGRDAKVTFPMQGRDLVLHGRVIRAEVDAQGRPCVGMCFRGVPTFVQDLIHDHVRRARDRAGQPPEPGPDTATARPSGNGRSEAGSA